MHWLHEMDFPPEYDSSNICPIVAARLPQCHHGVGCLTLPQLPRGALASNAFWLLQCCRGCCAATCAPRDYNSSAVTGWGDGVMRRRRGLRGEVRSSCLRFQYSFLFILHPHHIPQKIRPLNPVFQMASLKTTVLVSSTF